MYYMTDELVRQQEREIAAYVQSPRFQAERALRSQKRHGRTSRTERGGARLPWSTFRGPRSRSRSVRRGSGRRHVAIAG